MKVALSKPEQISKMVVVDIAPVTYSLRWDSDFHKFIAVMKGMDTVRYKSRSEADDEMAQHIPVINNTLLPLLVLSAFVRIPLFAIFF